MLELRSAASGFKEAFIYRDRDKLLYKLHPASKIVLFIASLIVSTIIHTLYSLLFYTLFIIALGFTGVETRRFTRILFSITLFILLINLFSILFLTPRILNGEISIKEVAIGCLVSICRFYSIALSFSIFFSTTRIQSIIRILSRARIPYTILYPIVFSIRYLSILIDDFINVYDVQRIRGVKLDTRNLLEKAKVLVTLSIPLLILSINRLNNMVISLENRGFGYRRYRTYYFVERYGSRDALFLSFLALVVVFAIYIEYLL